MYTNLKREPEGEVKYYIIIWHNISISGMVIGLFFPFGRKLDSNVNSGNITYRISLITILLCCVFSLIYLFPFAEKEDTDSDSGNMTFWYYSNPEAVLELYHLPVAILLLLF